MAAIKKEIPRQTEAQDARGPVREPGLPEKLVDVNKRASELLGGRPNGDDHYPGEVTLERLNLKRPLPRRG